MVIYDFAVLRHKNSTFREEYLDMLQKFEIEYDEKYVFSEIE